MKYKLKDIGTITTGKTPSKKIVGAYGKKINFLTPRDLNGQRYSEYTERRLSLKGIECLKNYEVIPPSISVSCIGSDMGKVVFNKTPIVTNQQLNSISNIRKDIDPLYLYYLLYNKRILLKFMGSDRGSTMPILSKREFGNLEFEFPNLKTQKSISSRLDSLDKKIEVNSRINDNLLDIAQNIYHRILFSPQITKTNLRSFATVVMGQSPSSKTYNENKIGIPLLNGAADFRNGIHPSKWTTDPKIIVNKGAYIFGVRATIGLTAKVSKSYAIGRGTGSAIPKDVKNEEILYFILNDMFKKFEQTESGSVYINISKNDFENYRFNIPDRNGLLFFHEKVKPIMDQIYIYKKQNKILQAIKAALLSKIF